jgi:RHS repeat-associated protein
LCYPATLTYVGEGLPQGTGNPAYLTPVYTNPVAAAQALAAWDNQNLSSCVYTGNYAFINCNRGVLWKDFAAGWDKTTEICYGQCSSFTTTPYSGPSFVGPATSWSFYIWGYSGYVGYVDRVVYNAVAGGTVRLHALCAQGDAGGYADYNAAGQFVGFFCVRATLNGTSAQVSLLSGDDGDNDGRACSCYPVDLATNQKYERVVDYEGHSPYPIVWARYYTGQLQDWHFAYDRHIEVGSPDASGARHAQVTRADGSTLAFVGTSPDGQAYTWVPDGAVYRSSTIKVGAIASRLSSTTDSSGAFTGFALQNFRDETERYDAQGRLTEIQGREGYRLRFAYDSQNRLQRITDDFGNHLDVAHASTQHTETLSVYDPSSPTGYVNQDQVYWSSFQDFSQQGTVTAVDDGYASIVYDYTPSVDAATGNTRMLLTAVAAPDGSVREYAYGEPLVLPVSLTGGVAGHSSAKAWDLTGVISEDGQRLRSYFYGANAPAQITAESLGDGLKITRFSLASGLTDDLGKVYTLNATNGQIYQTSGASPSPCPPLLCQGQPIAWKSQTFDAGSHATLSTDFMGVQRQRTFDLDRSVPLSVTEASNQPGFARTTTLTWDPRFRLPTSVTEPIAVNGVAATRTTTAVYDNRGHPQSVTVAPSTGETPRTTTYTYDALGLPASVTLPNGATATSTYDAQGHLTSWTDALGHAYTADQYTPNGLVGRITDPNGLETRFTYDARDRIVQVQRGTPATHWETQQMGYLASGTGLLDHVTLPDGRQVQFAYNTAQWLTQTRLVDAQGQPLGSVTYTYTTMGDPTGEQWFDAAGQPIATGTATYDAYHRLANRVGAAGQTRTTTYDAQSRPIQAKDPTGALTKQTYDALGRVATVTDALNHTATLAYDPQDALVRATDTRGNATTYAYNGFGELVGRTSPDSGTVAFTVDTAGRRTGATDARGVTTAIAYDALDRPTQVVYDSTGVAASTPGLIRARETQTFTYDTCAGGVGHLCTLTDASGTTAYAYDAWGRVTQTAFTAVGAAAPLTVGYTYDTQGRRVEETYPSGRTLTAAYGASGDVSGLNWAGQPVLNAVTYRAVGGEVTGWQWASLAAGGVTFDRDADSQVTQMTDSGAQGTTRTLGYDLTGRLNHVAVSGQMAWNQDYGYDGAGRLTQATLGAYPSPLTYAYDANGNRTLATNGSDSLTATTPATSNRLTALARTGIPTALSYDAAGNLIGDGQGLDLAYDAKGRLSTATSGGLQVTYGYNAAGQRVFKQVLGGPQAGTERYVYDGQGRLLGVYRADGTPIEETAYLDGWRPVALARPGSTNWTVYPILTDPLGTPRQVLDPVAGTPVWTWEAKEPFGAERPNETVGGSVFAYRGRFPGQVADPETGLVHNGFRDYDPALGRYLEVDPLGLGGGLNPYAYVEGSPLMGADPWGLKVEAAGGTNAEMLSDTMVKLSAASPTAAKVIAALETSDKIVRVMPAHMLNGGSPKNGFNGNALTVYWDPESGLMTTNGGCQSPAMGLIHEFGHAFTLLDPSIGLLNLSGFIDRYNAQKRVPDDDPNYGYKEERHVIEGIETDVAKELGEGTRTDHKGIPFHACSVMSNKKC